MLSLGGADFPPNRAVMDLPRCYGYAVPIPQWRQALVPSKSRGDRRDVVGTRVVARKGGTTIVAVLLIGPGTDCTGGGGRL